jgi:hypothetical protein
MKAPPRRASRQETEPNFGVEIVTPPTNEFGNCRINVDVTPEMYRNLVRASLIRFTRKDLAQICRMYIQAGIIQDVPAEDREV